MPRRIEALALLVKQLRIEVGVQDSLLVPERPGEVRAVGPDDRRAPPPDQLVSFAERHIVRVARGALEDAAGEDERARLARDVAHRLEPALGVVGGRREVHLDARYVERRARERHQVLPADEAADRTELR